MREVFYYYTRAILVFSSALLVACSSVLKDCSGISCWIFCELLQYILPNMIEDNIVKVGGHHNLIFHQLVEKVALDKGDIM